LAPYQLLADIKKV